MKESSLPVVLIGSDILQDVYQRIEPESLPYIFIEYSKSIRIEETKALASFAEAQNHKLKGIHFWKLKI